MNRTICLIFETPLIQSVLKTYCINYMQKMGHKIVLIDASALLCPEAYQSVTKDLINYEENQVATCLNKKEFVSKIEELPDGTVVLVDCGTGCKEHFIYKAITKKKLIYGYLFLGFDLSDACAVDIHNCFLSKDFYKKLSVQRMMNSLYLRIPARLKGLCPMNFIVANSVSGSQERKKSGLCDSRTMIRYLPSYFYWDILSFKDYPRQINESYCVFLDTYDPYHPDNLQEGIEMDDEAYYSEIRRFLSWISEIYHIKVVIAAHPRADYTIHHAAYEGFDVIKNKTCLLCRDAEFMINTLSGSMLYAIAYYKPLLLITLNELEKLSFHRKRMNYYLQVLKKDKINISRLEAVNEESINKQLTIDETVYTKICRDYIDERYDRDHIYDNERTMKELEDFIVNL